MMMVMRILALSTYPSAVGTEDVGWKKKRVVGCWLDVEWMRQVASMWQQNGQCVALGTSKCRGSGFDHDLDRGLGRSEI